MSVKKSELAEVLAAIERLRADLASLNTRVQTLETTLTAPAASTSVENVESRAATPHLPDELITIISAAIAAYLGKKPHIRQIRLVSSRSWSEQGRVSIQASHMLSMPPRH